VATLPDILINGTVFKLLLITVFKLLLMCCY